MAILRDLDRKRLEKNPNVLKVTSKNVTYKASFKVKAIKRYLAGEVYESIFFDAGIDVSLFDKGYARKCIDRWRKVYEKLGSSGFHEERRGRGSTGRPKGTKTFKNVEAEVAYLRAENDFLKKLHALEASYLKKKNSR